jgi:hypothetical protein
MAPAPAPALSASPEAFQRPCRAIASPCRPMPAPPEAQPSRMRIARLRALTQALIVCYSRASTRAVRVRGQAGTGVSASVGVGGPPAHVQSNFEICSLRVRLCPTALRSGWHILPRYG